MRWISYGKTADIRVQMETPIPSYGSVQGIIHSLQKEADRPYFRLRELSTESLVNCFYPLRLYSDVARALQERTNVLHVAGHMQFDRVTRSISELSVEKIITAKMLSGAEFEEFFGSCPSFTGEHSTEEWINDARSAV